MKKKQLTFEEMIGVRETALDKELIKHPMRTYRAAQQLTEAKKRLSEAKAAEELAEAVMAGKIRADPEKYIASGKLTEPALKEAVVRSKMVRECVAQRIAAQELVDAAYGQVNALSVKKDVLQDLVKLHGMSYFSTPRVDKETEQRASSSIQRHTKKRKPK